MYRDRHSHDHTTDASPPPRDPFRPEAWWGLSGAVSGRSSCLPSSLQRCHLLVDSSPAESLSLRGAAGRGAAGSRRRSFDRR